MSHLTTPNPALLARVQRIAGQVAAIERGLAGGTDCTTLLHLVAATKGAVSGLMEKIVEEHLHSHVADPDLSPEARAAGARDLMDAIRRYAK
ncbi:metal/formaldehyde-sensitive transcriptional repressor [Ancylobacter dichloromethanicus]|uniref:Transcriptional regulator n=1 Tax=Ancylobacter dichloromethanicus TaxID=518825 RepID=A0A9W6J5U5_9HYPH|nr:metal/formaldehyde-sensitive transcriptional repressor [Ancylobacter dichloromethanicus]MBS7554276.1 metal/formaldehyde-sensitive transcriptional repressor [Ancylobacter dichloromethanicus]GLK71400.1 transcriptional regulator [Ancylobacter dichloromethanicus]